MTLDKSVLDVEVIRSKINFRSKYFLREIKLIEKENKLMDKAVQPNYQKGLRRIENVDSSSIFY